MAENKTIPENIAEVTPEFLMDRFKGSSIVAMVVVTVVFHVVLILGTSMPYLKKTLFGDKLASMTKEQKIEKAVEEATSSIRKIAAENGLNPQEISDNFVSPAAKAAKAATAAAAAAPATNAPAVKPAVPKPGESGKEAKPDRPESQIEKDIKKSVKGPTAPPSVPKDDIF